MRPKLDKAASKEWFLILPNNKGEGYYHSCEWSRDYLSVTFVPDRIYQFMNHEKNAFVLDHECAGTMTVSIIDWYNARSTIHVGKHKFCDVIKFVNELYENIPEQAILAMLPPKC